MRAYYEALWLPDPLNPPDPVEPPGELQFLWLMEDTKALPCEGGLMDQPALLMDLISICISVRDEIEMVRAMRSNNGRN